MGLKEGAPRKYQGRLSHSGLVTFSCLTAASLSKMQICEMVITAASPSFVGLGFCFCFFCFLAHSVSPPLSTVLDSYHSGHESVFDECVSSPK